VFFWFSSSSVALWHQLYCLLGSALNGEVKEIGQLAEMSENLRNFFNDSSDDSDNAFVI